MIGCRAVDRHARAGRIVRDHSADGRTGTRGHIGAKTKSVRFEKCVQLIQNNASAGPDGASFQIQLRNLTIVAREFDDQSIADRSAGQTGAGATRRNRNPGLGGSRDNRAGLPGTARKRDRGRL